jgi:hypothetical protein
MKRSDSGEGPVKNLDMTDLYKRIFRGEGMHCMNIFIDVHRHIEMT